MTTLNDLGKAQENVEAYEQDLALRHLSWSVGITTAGDLCRSNGGALHVAEMIRAQRRSGLQPTQDPDLSGLTITDGQQAAIATHREARDSVLGQLAAEREAQSASVKPLIGGVQPRAAVQPLGRVNETAASAGLGK